MSYVYSDSEDDLYYTTYVTYPRKSNDYSNSAMATAGVKAEPVQNTKLLNKKESLSRDILAHLEDPELCDVKIVASDGEIPANKTIISMRSSYFYSMFSANNNYVESQSGTVKMPYTKAVLSKAILYLYSGEMDVKNLSLGNLLDLLELLNLLNLPEEFSTVETYVVNNIKKESFTLPDLLTGLDHSSKLGLQAVGETMLAHLGENYPEISKLEEVGALTEPMIFRLLEEKMEEETKTICRFNAFVTWLSSNSMEAGKKEEVLQKFDFNHFDIHELAFEVRKSGLYHTDKIIEGMHRLYVSQYY